MICDICESFFEKTPNIICEINNTLKKDIGNHIGIFVVNIKYIIIKTTNNINHTKKFNIARE